jgi:hypothetical protein
MKKYALALHNRNKVRYVSDAVKSMFGQVGPPIELLLSDNGSEDGSKALLDDLARSYNGPHKVRRLDCPYNGMAGMAGLNHHLNWIMTQTDADVVMSLAGDDYDLAQRSEMTIAAFEEHNPSMVLGGMYYVTEDMKYLGETPFLDVKDGSRWATLKDMTEHKMGGSTIQAWSREFFDAIGPMEGVGSIDVAWPMLAILMKGAWAIAPRIHCYRTVVGVGNTGLESVWKAYPEDDPRRLQTEELIHFQVMAGHYFTLARMNKLNLATEEAVNALAQAILDRSASWNNVRQKMSFEGISPIPFKV